MRIWVICEEHLDDGPGREFNLSVNSSADYLMVMCDQLQLKPQCFACQVGVPDALAGA